MSVKRTRGASVLYTMLTEYAEHVVAVMLGGRWWGVERGTFGMDALPFVPGVDGFHFDTDDGQHLCGPVDAIMALRWTTQAPEP